MRIYTDTMSWHQMILDQASRLGEEVECSIPSLDDAAMTRTFDCGYGSTNGKPFVAFTENFVLFPVEYDGAEWVGWAPRNPVDGNGNQAKPRSHQGG